MSIKVSVCCTTYNHERYLERCLDSLVCQKTNFKYEILVFEDCSTDSTKDILKKYVEKYPDLIVPLYQEENRYSKDIHVCENFVFPLVRGNYVALCEGDDYWTDENKLQKQFDALEQNPDCNFSAHRVALVEDDESFKGAYLPNSCFETGVYDADAFLQMGYLHTTSYFFRASKLKEYLETGLYKSADVFDVPILNYFALCGRVYYFADTMSSYRVGRLNNWMSTHNREKHCESMQKTLDAIDQYFDKKWTLSLDKPRFDNLLVLCYSKGHFKEIKGKRWKAFIKKLPRKLRLKIYIDFAFPWLITLKNKLKKQK